MQFCFLGFHVWRVSVFILKLHNDRWERNRYFLSGLVKHYLFWESKLLFKLVFLKVVVPLSCSRWISWGPPSTPAGSFSPCSHVVPFLWQRQRYAAENGHRLNNSYAHFCTLNMLISSPSSLHILGNRKEFLSLVYPPIPFEFWFWFPILATPTVGFWVDIHSNTIKNVYFGLSPLLLAKWEYRYFCHTSSKQWYVWASVPFLAVTVWLPKQKHWRRQSER